MKLVIAIVNDDDSIEVADALSENRFSATKMASTGGFLRTGNTTFFIGVEQERVDELGDASVPFNFDVHALIFTDDAPGLETALHNAFESRKLNKINPRREFFAVSLDEIKAEVRKNFDKTVEWIDVPEAEQYRQSLLIK